MNPNPFTLRELEIMADAKGLYDWRQVGSTLAMIGNMFKGKNETKLKPEDFNPYIEKHKTKRKMSEEETEELLKKVFIDRKM